MHPVLQTLTDIERELTSLELWSEQRPSAEALASTQPFCIDTLTLPEWIQFVLLDNLYAMIEQSVELPKQCGVTPIAEEYFKHSPVQTDQLLVLLRQLDRQLTKL